MLLADLDVSDTPFAPDARIHNCDVDGTGRKPGCRFGQHDRAGPDVMRRDGVRQINNCRPWINRKNHTLHCGYISAADTKVGRERDNRWRLMIWSHAKIPLAKD